MTELICVNACYGDEKAKSLLADALAEFTGSSVKPNDFEIKPSSFGLCDITALSDSMQVGLRNIFVGHLNVTTDLPLPTLGEEIILMHGDTVKIHQGCSFLNGWFAFDNIIGEFSTASQLSINFVGFVITFNTNVPRKIVTTGIDPYPPSAS